jgi:hypothetical protein
MWDGIARRRNPADGNTQEAVTRKGPIADMAINRTVKADTQAQDMAAIRGATTTGMATEATAGTEGDMATPTRHSGPEQEIRLLRLDLMYLRESHQARLNEVHFLKVLNAQLLASLNKTQVVCDSWRELALERAPAEEEVS